MPFSYIGHSIQFIRALSNALSLNTILQGSYSKDFLCLSFLLFEGAVLAVQIFVHLFEAVLVLLVGYVQYVYTV